MWVVRWFGEGVARKIEQFVDGAVFQDSFVICPQCETPVAATLIAERDGLCPICRTVATNDLTVEALEARKGAALAAGEVAHNDVAEIDRLLEARRPKG